MTGPEEERRAAERSRAQAWIEQHWVRDQSCPIDGSREWSVSDLVEVRPFNGGNLVVGGGVYPLFLVTCITCGYTLFFNGLMSGVLPNPQDDRGSEKPE